MVKLYRDMAANVWAGLHYAKIQGVDLHLLEAGLRNPPHEEGEARDRARFMHDLMEGPDVGTLQEIMDAIYIQLRDEQRDDKTNMDLIDEIVRTLGLPFCRNTLSGETINRLRKAILLPDERAGLVKRLRERSMSCSNCGHQFHNGEMGTLYYDGREHVILCTNCHRPTQVACHTCGGTHSADIADTQVLNDAIFGTRCTRCEGTERIHTEVGATGDAPPANPFRPPWPRVNITTPDGRTNDEWVRAMRQAAANLTDAPPMGAHIEGIGAGPAPVPMPNQDLGNIERTLHRLMEQDQVAHINHDWLNTPLDPARQLFPLGPPTYQPMAAEEGEDIEDADDIDRWGEDVDDDDRDEEDA